MKKSEDVPEFFQEQAKIIEGHFGKFGVNNIFERIDLSEISDVANLLFDEEEMQKVEEKAKVWNVSYNGQEHQNGDRIFWFYILSEDGVRKMHTCNHRQFDSLLSDYEFIDYHDYQGLEKSTEAFQHSYEEISHKISQMGLTLSIDKVFPIFKKMSA